MRGRGVPGWAGRSLQRGPTAGVEVPFLVALVSAAVHPAPVGSNPFGAGRRRRGKRQIGQTNMLPFAAMLAHGFEAAIIVHHLDAEDTSEERQGEILFDHGEESARLFLLVMAIDGRFLDRLVQLPRGESTGSIR